jgi:hypothetical protein
MIRMVKSLLVLTVGANALFCALQNIANLDEARGALAYVISGAGQETYKHTLFFYSSNPALAWLALAVVLAGEFSIAVFGVKGAWELFSARNGTTEAIPGGEDRGSLRRSAGRPYLVRPVPRRRGQFLPDVADADGFKLAGSRLPVRGHLSPDNSICLSDARLSTALASRSLRPPLSRVQRCAFRMSISRHGEPIR